MKLRNYRKKVIVTSKKNLTLSFLSRSPAQTLAFARKFAKKLLPGASISLGGDLGAGKTTFVKGIALGLGIKNVQEVKSPTFVILHIYSTKVPLYHFDLYRLDEEKDFRAIGLDEFVYDSKVITCVEWAEKAKNWLASFTHQINLENVGPNVRRITITQLGRPVSSGGN